MVMFLTSVPLLGQKNLLKNFGYSPKDPGWEVWAARELRLPHGKPGFPGQKFRIRFTEGKLSLYVPVIPNAKVWFAQVRQRINLTVGRKYRFQVKVKADKPGIIAMRYELDCPPWNSLGLNKRIKVSMGEKIYTAEFTVDKNTSKKPVAVKLCFGMLPGNITASEVKLELLKKNLQDQKMVIKKQEES